MVIVEQASEDELANAVGRANKTGLLCCPHTGVALAALEKLTAKGVIKAKDRNNCHIDGQWFEVHRLSLEISC